MDIIFKNIIKPSLDIIKQYEDLSLSLSPNGFHLAFSGGKDSQVIYKLMELSGCKFVPYFYKTSVDPPGLIAFIKEFYPRVIILKPEKTMYQLILQHHCLPMRNMRFCCESLKERRGINELVVIGIRASESNARKKRVVFSDDCRRGGQKFLLSPILNYSLHDVFSFLQHYNIKLNPLYAVHNRIGCVGCPMSSKSMRHDFALYPNYRLAYYNTIQKLIDMGYYDDFDDADDVLMWWSGRCSKKDYFELKKQTKLL